MLVIGSYLINPQRHRWEVPRFERRDLPVLTWISNFGLPRWLWFNHTTISSLSICAMTSCESSTAIKQNFVSNEGILIANVSIAHTPSKLNRSLSSCELFGIMLVPLWIAQLNTSWVGVMLIPCAIFWAARSLATLNFMALSKVREPQAVMCMFYKRSNKHMKGSEWGTDEGCEFILEWHHSILSVFGR